MTLVGRVVGRYGIEIAALSGLALQRNLALVIHSSGVDAKVRRGVKQK